jgi:hypothetical protein
VDDLDVVYTNFDPEFEFEAQSTFAVPDRVVKIESENFTAQDGEDPQFVNPEVGDRIISRIRRNMTDLGWTEVNGDADPDVIILPSVSTRLDLQYHYDWRYWSWYYPGFYPGWSWWYPNYRPMMVSGVRSGSVLLQMTHPDGMGGNDNIPVVWTGVFNGLLQGSQESINQRISQTIDQAFNQSPYLNIE